MKKETMYSHVEAWKKEKGTISKEEFCNKNKISKDSLGYWLTRYNKEFTNSSKKKEQLEFIPVEIKEETLKQEKEKAKVKVEIELPTGLILRIY